MSKTLVIAEKPSVGRDLAATLPGAFKQSQDKTHLVGGDYVITWAVGHLVGLAEPDQYDEKLKKWRFADLPIVPEKFKLIPNDERAKKQLNAVHKLMKDKDVDLIVNACDAGREGELIFAYLFETSGVKKPVKRLWLNSMTKAAIQEAFAHLREGEEMRPARGRRPLALRGRLARRHERDARGLYPPARSVRRRRLARPRADADTRARRSPRAGDPRLRPRAVLARRGDASPRQGSASTAAATSAASGSRRTRRRRSSPRPPGSRARSRSSRRRRSARRRSSSTTSRRSSATRTRSSASPRGGRSPRRRSSTRSTRRSPTRARTRASSRAT